MALTPRNGLILYSVLGLVPSSVHEAWDTTSSADKYNLCSQQTTASVLLAHSGSETVGEWQAFLSKNC